MTRDPLCDRLRKADNMTLTALLQALRYYAAEGNYDENGAPTYTDLSPPEGWLGEEYEERVRLDEGKAARQALDDLERGWLEPPAQSALAWGGGLMADVPTAEATERCPECGGRGKVLCASPYCEFHRYFSSDPYAKCDRCDGTGRVPESNHNQESTDG